MDGLIVPAVPFTLRLHDVFGYVQSDFAMDHASFEPVTFCLAFHHPDFVAKKSGLARVGVRDQRFYETIASLPGFGMAPVGHLSYSAGPTMRARRTQPCSVRVRIDPLPRKGLPRLQTCHRQ